jgi:hypothetical protein
VVVSEGIRATERWFRLREIERLLPIKDSSGESEGAANVTRKSNSTGCLVGF